MKILNKRWLALILLVLSILYTSVYAADALYRFMHNDHDALIIGEIISIDENAVKVRVEKNIISSKDLNVNSAKKQLKLTEAKIVSPFGYRFFHNQDGRNIIEPSVGDYVLLSLIKSGSGFKVAWGAYKVDSLDYKNLSVVLPENASVWSVMDAAAIKTFVNSNGEITEFSFDGNTKTVRAGEEIIFTANDEETADADADIIQNISEENNETGAGSSIAIIGGADGPTSIFISGSPTKTLVILIIAGVIVIVFRIFIIRYAYKGKRRK